MDSEDLRSRLNSIKQKSLANTLKRIDPGEVLPEHGWTRVDDMVYEKATVSKNLLPDVISDTLVNPAAGEPSFNTAIPSSDFIFYDTETTGLSAGAGNMVFLAGFGFVDTGDRNNFRIVQLLLSDFPGEPAFLEYMKKFIDKDRIYVSYNGRSFDSNILKSRYAMNGMKAEFGYQLDLLYSSRRIWKDIIGSCSLGDIERRVLDKYRILDVPGFMVPNLYFDFMKSGRFDYIEGVIAHHQEDISSLAELLVVQEQLFSDTDDVNDYYDPIGLASLLIDKQPLKAERLLHRSFEKGNGRAGLNLGFILKKKGSLREAECIWRELWEKHKSISAAVELAKYHEHRIHDLEKALQITNDILSLERIRIKQCLPELEKRRKRLELKIKNKAVKNVEN